MKAAAVMKAAQVMKRDSESGPVCVICCHHSDFYCIGPCGHPVCCECGIRLRVLCESKDCPVCRSPLVELWMVSSETLLVLEPKAPPPLISDPSGAALALRFENTAAVEAFQDLLAHVCTVCTKEPEFTSMEELEKHMRRIHGLYYCSLCLKHLKLFSWERKTYKKPDLILHQKVMEELEKHMRRIHGLYYCSLCLKHLKLFSWERKTYKKPDLILHQKVMEELEKHMRRIHGLYYCSLCLKHLKLFSWERKTYKKPDLILHQKVMEELEKHMRRIHGLYYCSLCLKHLKLFSWERKTYKKPDLILHQKVMEELEKHMRRIHGLYYCSLCLKHLKLFSWERKTYKKPDLILHQKHGDPDDRSHRGHPGCQFCRELYLDNDALWIHLRRDHFYCHFCDADGAPPFFYNTYENLKGHFKKDHFLCELGDCAYDQFTPAFRNKVDFDVHQGTHKEGKKPRLVQLEWGEAGRGRNLGPGRGGDVRGGRGGRGAGGRERGGFQAAGQGGQAAQGQQGSGRGRPLPYHRQMELERAATAQPEPEEHLIPVASGGSSKVQSVIRVRDGGHAQPKVEDFKQDRRDFPRLGTSSDGFPGFAGGVGPQWSGRNQPTARLLQDAEEFPSLVSQPTPSQYQAPQPPPTRQAATSRQPAVKPKQQPQQQRGMIMIDDDEAFPSLKSQREAQAREEAAQEAARRAAADEEEEEDAEQEEGGGFVSRVRQGAPGSLSQATACLSLAKNPAPGGKEKVKGVKGAWALRSLASDQTKNSWAAHNTPSAPGEELAGFDWIKTEAKKSDSGPKKKTKPAKKDAVNLVSIGTKAKARAVARAKQGANQDTLRVRRTTETDSILEEVEQGLSEDTVPTERKVTQTEFSDSRPPGLSGPPPGLAPAPPGLSSGPPGLTSGPPGLSGPPASARPAPGPPPGLSVRPLSARLPGKAEEAPPPGLSLPRNGNSSSPELCQYQKPSDFTKRNKALFDKIWARLNPSQLDEFKAESREFRSGRLEAGAYRDAVCRLLGDWPELGAQLAELIALLPDIPGQKALLSAASKLLPSRGGKWGSGGLCACPRCGQVLQPWDLQPHQASHSLDINFPSLS